MAFQEVHASQFASPTTCYTGCRHADGSFATETHSIHWSCSNGDVNVTTGPFPCRHVCVGHDQSGAWELFAFLDPDSSGQDTEPVESSRRIAQTSTLESSVSSLPDFTVEASTSGDAGSPIAHLTLQSQSPSALNPVFSTSLTNRPLTPCLTMLPSTQEDQNILAWVGCPDDSQLRCYVIDSGNHGLTQVELRDDAFSFDSPVLVMDSLESTNDDDSSMIAVGCQDGTVRVISFRNDRTGDNLEFKHLTSHSVLVDGPIMALHLAQPQGDGPIQLLVGSMCGFVCQLVLEDKAWRGPCMVADGLMHKDSEDAVLAVHVLSDTMVGFGTLSGRCEVWQKRADSTSYGFVWRCQLPYSIHGVSHAHTSSNEHQPVLLVTTRHTFHVFRRDCPKYKASTVRHRLEGLIRSRQQQVANP